ncbi:MAG TPA: hypothetical protein DDW27_17265 [Bacteroidales bacterium]|nr:hypothetical protein [Bacteroidales bacterium]
MKIAYISNYLGPLFIKQYCNEKRFSVSATFKSTAIARALLKGGHDVTIFSPGITICNRFIKSYVEVVYFPEGLIKIFYPEIISFRKCSFINSILLWRVLRKKSVNQEFDLLLFYNISWDAALCLPIFSNRYCILEYEDNIFNKALKGQKNKFEWLKLRLFRHVIKQIDAAIITGKEMLNTSNVKTKVHIPGAISEDVIDNIVFKEKTLSNGFPVKLLLAGGLHYSKGPDLIIKALSFVKYSCELTLYGSGLLDTDAVGLIPTVPKYHKIILHDFVQHDELIKIMSNEAHILLNSTRDMGVPPGSAGYPFKMMEYASTGRPIVSSRIGRFDDEFNKLVTFYENEDPEEIGQAITYVIEHYQECARMALVLQKRTISEFSIDGISQKLNLFIKEVSNNNGS